MSVLAWIVHIIQARINQHLIDCAASSREPILSCFVITITALWSTATSQLAAVISTQS